jgi:hypothetical protein
MNVAQPGGTVEAQSSSSGASSTFIGVTHSAEVERRISACSSLAPTSR